MGSLYTFGPMRLLSCLLLITLAAAARAQTATPSAAVPEAVSFPSLDARTQLTAFLYRPDQYQSETPGPWPAVVMLHGRAGAYSSTGKGRHDATHISQRHRMWGEFWAKRGYAALLVDSFGPRGYAAGFPARDYRNRPAEVSEQAIRPLDAYGALAWLRTRSDVVGDRVGLHGWSNGAMAALATLASRPREFSAPFADAGPATAFRSALALYPGCGAQANTGWQPYAPLLMMVASRDEEVSPLRCRRLADEANVRSAPGFEFVWYEGAQHAFDDPSRSRQAVAANQMAGEDSKRRAEAFFQRTLKVKPAAERLR